MGEAPFIRPQRVPEGTRYSVLKITTKFKTPLSKHHIFLHHCTGCMSFDLSDSNWITCFDLILKWHWLTYTVFLSLLALKISLRDFFTILLEGTGLLDFWVHYPTLSYSKLKKHSSLGPALNMRRITTRITCRFHHIALKTQNGGRYCEGQHYGKQPCNTHPCLLPEVRFDQGCAGRSIFPILWIQFPLFDLDIPSFRGSTGPSGPIAPTLVGGKALAMIKKNIYCWG